MITVVAEVGSFEQPIRGPDTIGNDNRPVDVRANVRGKRIMLLLELQRNAYQNVIIQYTVIQGLIEASKTLPLGLATINSYINPIPVASRQVRGASDEMLNRIVPTYKRCSSQHW